MTAEKLAKVLTIIMKYTPKSQISAEHDQIWFGNPKGLTEEDKADLERLNAFFDDLHDSWAVFT